MMENARVLYDVFIQNSLKSTSHSVQWLPYQLDDNDYPAFTKKYFLLGTHNEDEEEGDKNQDSLYIGEVRVPKLGQKSTIDYTKLEKDHSQLKIVKEFNHEGDVSKARAMK
jgi:hypothetical protein